MTDHLLGLLRGYPADPSDLRLGLIADAANDAGQHERAELIRVQCELARQPNCEWVRKGRVRCRERIGSQCSVCLLRLREAELLREWWGRWMSVDHFAEACCTNLCKRDYCDCLKVTFTRGLLHIAAPLAELEAGLRRMGDEAWWVGSVRATDYNPSHYNGYYFWHDDRRDMSVVVDRSNYLPADIYDRLDWSFDLSEGTSSLTSLDAAHAVVSRALLASVREPGRVAATTKGG